MIYFRSNSQYIRSNGGQRGNFFFIQYVNVSCCIDIKPQHTRACCSVTNHLQLWGVRVSENLRFVKRELQIKLFNSWSKKKEPYFPWIVFIAKHVPNSVSRGLKYVQQSKGSPFHEQFKRISLQGLRTWKLKCQRDISKRLLLKLISVILLDCNTGGNLENLQMLFL